MAVYFHSSASEISVEVGEYEEFTEESEEFTRPEPVRTSNPKHKHLSVVVLSFGVLCMLQAILNISLRLTLTQKAENAASESFTTKLPALLNTTEGLRDRSCPPKWLRYESSCYYISSQRKDWDRSQRDCEKKGSHLVIINNRQEQAFLSGFTPSAWIGMTDRKKEGTFFWIDGTLVKKNELQWAPGQPDNAFGGEDCGDIRTMDNFIGLNDNNCSIMIQWICEKPLAPM